MARFEKKARLLEEDGYQRYDLVIDIVKANIYAIIIMLPFAALIAVPYLLLHGFRAPSSFGNYLIFLVLFVILMIAETVLHEAIHGLVWGLLNQEGFSAIEFGLIKEYLTPYCYCASPLSRGQYILGSVMPTIVLGFLQGLLAVITGSSLLFYLSLVLMIGGGGDFLIIFRLLLYRKKKRLLILMDHPTELGSVLFEK